MTHKNNICVIALNARFKTVVHVFLKSTQTMSQHSTDNNAPKAKTNLTTMN